MALSALRPFVRLSQRLERQVVTPAEPAAPAPQPSAPAPAPAPPAPPAPAIEHHPDPTPPADIAPAPDATSPDDETTDVVTEQYESIDASVVPVPIESLNRLVLAVDELGSEMTQVRQAIRELTAALSESQANFARMLAAQTGGAADAPDPFAAVSGPYVSGEPTAFPAAQAAAAPAAAPSEPPVTPVVPPVTPVATEPPTVPMPTVMPAPTPAATPHHGPGPGHDGANGRPTTPTAGLDDLPIVSSGAVQVVIGPISSLDELDDAVEHMRRINGVESVAVTSFDGPQVLLTADLVRALPLASLLRHELGREVVSCRVVDGRIVADFGQAGRRA